MKHAIQKFSPILRTQIGFCNPIIGIGPGWQRYFASYTVTPESRFADPTYDDTHLGDYLEKKQIKVRL